MSRPVMTVHEVRDYLREKDAIEDAMIARTDAPGLEPVLDDAMGRAARRLARGRSSGEDLIEVLVRAHEAEHGWESPREPQPEVPCLRMPLAKPARTAEDFSRVAGEEAVQALLRAAVAKARVPKRRLGTAGEYRAELLQQAAAQFYTDPSQPVQRAVEAARWQLAKLHRESGGPEIDIKARKDSTKPDCQAPLYVGSQFPFAVDVSERHRSIQESK